MRSPRRRLRVRPRGLVGRSVAAAVLAVLVLGLAAWWWARTSTYDDQMDASRALARSQVDQILAQTVDGTRLGGDYGSFPYELVAGRGEVVSASSVVTPFEDGHSLMPAPGYGGPQPLYAIYPVRLPASIDSPLAGREVETISGTISARDVASGSAGRPGDVSPGARYRVYVFVLDDAALQARARVDHLALVALPTACLFVGLIVWAAVGVTLRSVRLIAAHTRGVTARDPRERVPVPPSGDAIEDLADTINETLDRLQRTQDEQRRFVADASHELRSPLAALAFGLEVAHHHPELTPPAQVVESALGSARRLEALVADLLDLATLDAGAVAEPTQVPLRDVMAQALSDLPTPGHVTLVPPADLDLECEVLAVAGLLARALHNVVANALRHATRAVEITVSLAPGRTSDTVTIDVDDDGPGIAPADRTRVLGRFTRLDDARARDTGGSGLGLAIARDAVAVGGGSLTILDRPGGGPGCRVRLTLRGRAPGGPVGDRT
ncbi:HAMP domain-containing sensor histidine kinase [Nocardioides acrostichi]|uniref:histidine kinase n=1 Tax=Nocardioides acrostichi TaxID=2784339 RepID=A0A930Y582_9ACTN|nr:HAMP domain-containing sensor histidine kinase [Nocardioides acrostichi]MBF4160985.1 HAMP domain-containing histidine kinase [Nocardioides acrostichi]